MTTNAWASQPFEPTSGSGKYRLYLYPSAFQRAVARILAPLMMLGTIWLPFGHLILGSSGGWMIFVGFLFYLPAFLVVCGVHGALQHTYARSLGLKAYGPFSSVMTLVFLVALAAYPFTVTDFGDSSDSYAPSKAQVLFGLNDDDAATVLSIATIVLIACAAALIISDIVDLVRLNAALVYSGRNLRSWPNQAGATQQRILQQMSGNYGYNIWNGRPRPWGGQPSQPSQSQSGQSGQSGGGFPQGSAQSRYAPGETRGGFPPQNSQGNRSPDERRNPPQGPFSEPPGSNAWE